MYRFTLLVVFVTLLGGSIVQAASYEKRDGTIVGPILDINGSPHSYSGNNVEPSANLASANLASANLLDANLRYAYLSGAGPGLFLDLRSCWFGGWRVPLQDFRT